MNVSVKQENPHVLGVEFDRKVSLGNLMSALVIIVSVIGAYFALDSRTQINAEDVLAETKDRQEDVTELNGRLANLEGKFEALVDSINNDRLGAARQMTQLSSDISYVKSTIDDVRRTINQNGSGT